MNSKGRSIPFAGTVLFPALLLFALVGCKKEDDPFVPVEGDLYPLVVGNQIVYSGYVLSPTDSVLSSTAALYESRWTVTSNAAPLPPIGGLTGMSHLIIDSTKTDTGAFRASNMYIERASATGNSNMSLLYNFGPFYRAAQVIQLGGGIRSDSLQWVLMAKQDAGVGNTWTAFERTWTTITASVTLKVDGEFDAEAQISVGGQSFSAYRAVLKRSISSGPAPIETDRVVLEVWFVAGIGPVKMIIHGDGLETYGHYREYRSKNFN